MTQQNVSEPMLLGKVILSGKLVVRTGLHIGTQAEEAGIGAVDNPIIKSADGKPYIPGSSIKGKVRALMEKKEFPLTRQEFKKIKSHSCQGEGCTVCNLFGRDAEAYRDKDDLLGPRLIVRDAYPSNWRGKETEIKYEAAIDRLNSKANPRPVERVPPDTEFDVEVIFNVLKKSDHALLVSFLQGLELLQDDFLGGSGTRGSGKVSFRDLAVKLRSKSYYEGNKEEIVILSGASLPISSTDQNTIKDSLGGL